MDETKEKIKELESKYGCQMRSSGFFSNLPHGTTLSAIDSNNNTREFGRTGGLGGYTLMPATSSNGSFQKDAKDQIDSIDKRIKEITTQETRTNGNFANGYKGPYLATVAKTGFEEEYEQLKAKRKEISTNTKQVELEKLKEYTQLVNHANVLESKISGATWQSKQIETLKQKSDLPLAQQEKILEKIKNKASQLEILALSTNTNYILQNHIKSVISEDIEQTFKLFS